MEWKNITKVRAHERRTKKGGRTKVKQHLRKVRKRREKEKQVIDRAGRKAGKAGVEEWRRSDVEVVTPTGVTVRKRGEAPEEAKKD